MRAVRDDEAVVGGLARIGIVAGFGLCGFELLVPDIAEALVEEEREDELLVVASIHEPAQERSGAPQIGFQLLLRQVVGGLAHSSQPPSTRVVRRWSSAARESASACLKAATASERLG